MNERRTSQKPSKRLSAEPMKPVLTNLLHADGVPAASSTLQVATALTRPPTVQTLSASELEMATSAGLMSRQSALQGADPTSPGNQTEAFVAARHHAAGASGSKTSQCRANATANGPRLVEASALDVSLAKGTDAVQSAGPSNAVCSQHDAQQRPGLTLEAHTASSKRKRKKQLRQAANTGTVPRKAWQDWLQ